jgi:hypothetical protein
LIGAKWEWKTGASADLCRSLEEFGYWQVEQSTVDTNKN